MTLLADWHYPYPTTRRSPLCRDYNLLASRLLERTWSGDGQALVLTSAWDGDGKTYTALNLAANLALRGRKTLLLDTDSVGATLTRRFGLPAESGWVESLKSCGTELSAHPVPGLDNLEFMALGQPNSNGNDLETLLHAYLAHSLKQLRSHYEVVLADAGCLLGGHEARILLRAFDDVLLVVRGHRTTAPDIKCSIAEIEKCNGHIYGLVLNAYKEYVPRAFKAWL